MTTEREAMRELSIITYNLWKERTMDNTKQTKTDEQQAADAQLLAYVKDLQDIEVHQFAGYGSPRHMTQGAPRWDFKHHAFVVNDEGLVLSEFTTGDSTATIQMEACELEQFTSVLLDWYVGRRIRGLASINPWTSEIDDPFNSADESDDDDGLRDDYRDLTEDEE
jgi:hypothetical protein